MAHIALSRESVGVPEGPINFDDADGAPRRAVREAGYDLKALLKRGKPMPTFEVILGQRSGVFLVEFYWRKPGGGDWHVVAINCDQRRVFCNTLGVVPFHKRNTGYASPCRMSSGLRSRPAGRPPGSASAQRWPDPRRRCQKRERPAGRERRRSARRRDGAGAPR